jgi:NTE family protein
VGTEPNIEWLQGSGIEMDDGVRVNEFMETNLAHVFAAGDVVNFYDVILEDHHRQGNWVNASLQGEMAATNMCGGREKYEKVTAFTVDVFGLGFVFLGEYDRSRADEAVIEAEGEKVKEYYLKDSRVIGACLINAPEERAALEQQIKNKTKFNKK